MRITIVLLYIYQVLESFVLVKCVATYKRLHWSTEADFKQ